MQEKVIPVAAGMDPTTGPKRLKLEFAYDAQHRRVMKRVKEWMGDAATGGFTNVVKDRRYVYDGWNMIAESSRGTEARWTAGAAGCPAGVRARAERPNQLDHTTATGNGLEGSTVVRTQVWGQDLSGTMQGAGGVGGLLAVRHDGQTYVPLMDGNGNVMGLQGLGGAKDGQTVARYDYDAFGNRITNTAPELGEEVNPFGFSTKFTDVETGLVYYGFRYYSPELGRWLSRDPIGERGGINLYGMVRNNPVNRIDVNGLWTWGGILGALLEGVGLEYEAAVFDDAWNDTIIDSYGGPEGFMDATERELAEKGQLPVDLFRKARAKNKAPINQGSEKALHDRLQAAMKNSKHYKDKRDFIIKRLKEGTAHQGFVNVDFQDAGENELGYSIGGGQLHYKYTDGPPPKVEFRVKDTYDFTKKGHVWGRLQDQGYLVIFDEDIFVEEVLCPKAK